jgi:hypothetical protein
MSQTKVITGEVRFSYAHVFEPSSINEADAKKYSASILIPKTDKVTLSKIEKAIEAAKQEGKGKWNGKIPPVLKLPLRDGDVERPDDEAYEGMMFLNASSKNKPGIVDENRDGIMSNDEFYSGCYGRASLNLYAFNVNGNKGIAVGLNNLQKLRDGDRLSGGGSSAAYDFGDEDSLLG